MGQQFRLVETADAAKWPHDVDVEEAVLGVILAKPDYLDALGRIEEDDFFCTWHGAVFYIAECLRADGRSVSALSVISELRSLRAQGITDHIPDGDYDLDLNEIAICAPRNPDWAKAAGESLRSLAQRRRLIAALEAGQLDTIGAKAGETPLSLAARVVEAVQAVIPQPETKATKSQILNRVLERAERAEADTSLKVYSGLSEWDAKIGGMRPGELHIIGARPGMGKTIVGANFALSVAETGQGSLYASMEMSSEQLSSRVLCDMVHRGGQELWTRSLRKGSIPPYLMQPLIDASDRLEGLPLIIDDRRGLTLQEIGLAAQASRRDLKKQGRDLALIVIDYMTLIQPSDRYKGNKVAEVTELSRGLKMLAGDMELPIVALCQLNRNTEARGNADNKPRLSDLRESGSIEQDADTISLLYREEYYVMQKEPSLREGPEYGEWSARLGECRDVLEINIAKNRDGETGIIKAKILARCSAVRDE